MDSECPIGASTVGTEHVVDDGLPTFTRQHEGPLGKLGALWFRWVPRFGFSWHASADPSAHPRPAPGEAAPPR